MCKFCALLSHRLCVPIRDALCACAALAGRGRTSASTAFGASGRRPLRRAIGKRCVGAGVLDGPHRTCANFPINRRAGCPQPADWPCAALPAGPAGPALQKYCVLPRADRVVRPYKGKPCRAGPMCPALHYPPRPLQKTCHCEPVTDVTGAAIRTPPTPCWPDGTGESSVSAVRRDVGIAPYGYFEGWCRRADVGIAPYGGLSVNGA